MVGLLLPTLGLENIVGIALGFSRFFAGSPTASRYRTPSVMKQSASKCFEQRTEYAEGPFQPARCSFTARVHLATKAFIAREFVQAVALSAYSVASSSNTTCWHDLISVTKGLEVHQSQYAAIAI